MKRLILAALVLVLLGTSGLLYSKLRHPSFAPYAALERPATPVSVGTLQVHFLGVSTLLLDDGETALMTDGFFSRPGLLRVLLGTLSSDPSRIDHGLRKAGVTRLAAVMTAHSHHDHAMDAPEVARRTDALLLGSASTANIARGRGFPEDRLRIIQGGETFNFGRFKVTTIQSPHSPDALFPGVISAPLPSEAKASAYKEGGNFSFLIEHQGRRLLIHPSANFKPGFLKNIQVDVVFLGIGALGKQSTQFTQDYWREVVQATGAKVVVPIHWDDFMQPLDEPLQPMPYLLDDFDLSMQRLQQLAEADKVALRFMPIFEPSDILGAIKP